jgi:hypothetical protein
MSNDTQDGDRSIITENDMHKFRLLLARGGGGESPHDARELLKFIEIFVERKMASYARKKEEE